MCAGALALLLFTSLLTGCHAEPKLDADTQDALEYTSIEQLNGKLFAEAVDSVYNQTVIRTIKDAKHSYYSSLSDQVGALVTGKADAIALDAPTAGYVLAQNQNVGIVPEPLEATTFNLGLQKGSKLMGPVNGAIATLRENGTLAAMEAKWFGSDESVKVLPELTYPGASGTLRVSHDTNMPPMAYLGADGTAVGFDLELMLQIGKVLDYKVEFVPADFSGVVPMLQSGRVDMAVGALSSSEERQEILDFSDPYYECNIYLVVREMGVEPQGLWESIVSGFTINFLNNDRWLLILDGLKVTLLISLCSGVLGLVLGFFVCAMRRSRYPLVRIPAAILVQIVQGTPILVFLMILYYLVFTSVNISATAVATIAFAIYFAVTAGEAMSSGLDTVEVGQFEASTAIGFSKFQRFWQISFPQAARYFIPQLTSGSIALVQSTSVVGFIAVQDLTKVGDIIRGATMDAYFPLITTALIYFLISNLLTLLLRRVEIYFDPKRRKRVVKGVMMK